MQSPNAMAASHGPVPALGLPPTPDSLVNKAALAALVFSTDAKKFRTFARQFRSAIGAQYKNTMDRAIEDGNLNPVEPAAIVMHTAIYDMLIITFRSRTRMTSLTT